MRGSARTLTAATMPRTNKGNGFHRRSSIRGQTLTPIEENGQLFLEVLTENDPYCCRAFRLPHLGHLTRALSWSAMDTVWVKTFRQASQRYE